jgi:hypothetical protein
MHATRGFRAVAFEFAGRERIFNIDHAYAAGQRVVLID